MILFGVLYLVFAPITIPLTAIPWLLEKYLYAQIAGIVIGLLLSVPLYILHVLSDDNPIYKDIFMTLLFGPFY